jgi:hypothetical protein
VTVGGNIVGPVTESLLQPTCKISKKKLSARITPRFILIDSSEAKSN